MTDEVYDQLIKSLAKRGGFVIPPKGKEILALLKELFTPEEADLTNKLPLAPSPLEKIAQDTGINMEDVTLLLEGMVNKGLAFIREKGGMKLYSVLPIAPGIFEYQFMKGEVNERTKKLAGLFEAFFQASKHLPTAPTVPFSRVIPIEKEIQPGVEVHPYEKVSAYIEESDHIALSVCYCRHHGELIGKPCDKPKDVCLSFGPTAKFNADKGFGRLITKEEAMEVLQRSEDAGLVHCSSNTSQHIDFICNCCLCHCGIIQSLKDTQMTNYGATSEFIIDVDAEKCEACEACLERCPMEALSMKEEQVELEKAMCIGCGLCAPVCPTEALKLVPRETFEAPPSTHRDLMQAMMKSMQQR